MKNISALGLELNIGDKVSFDTTGIRVIGEIIGFENDKAIIKPTGVSVASADEFEATKAKVKKQYKIRTRRCYKCTAKKKEA